MAKLIKIGNKWYSDLRIGKKRIRRALSIYKPKAQKMLEDLVSLRRMQRHGGSIENISWYTFRLRWLAFRKPPKVSPSTYSMDMRSVRYLEHYFPILQRLSQITPERLEELRTLMTKDKKGIYAIDKCLVSLKAMMVQAEKWRLVPIQDWRIVKIRPSRKRVAYYSIDEFKRLLALTKGPWRTAAMLMGRAGLRPGEVRHLEWGDINFKDRIIHIRIKEHLNWKPKKSTAESPHERVVDMPVDLEAHLKSIARPSGFVLGPDLVKDYTFRTYFQNLSKKAKVPGFAYVFRHSYASHLISNGVPLEAVGELLGHSDYRSTKIYAHLMPHARREAVDRLPSL